jgi:hypothetical protein
MLDQLPLEILHLIVGEVSSFSNFLVSIPQSPQGQAHQGLGQPLRASKILHRSVLPFLYRTLAIKGDELFLAHLEIPQVKTIFGTDGERTIINILPYVRHLHFTSQIKEKTRKRCYSDGYIAHPRTKDHWRKNLDSHCSCIAFMNANVQFGLSTFPFTLWRASRKLIAFPYISSQC